MVLGSTKSSFKKFANMCKDWYSDGLSMADL